jgi:predicted metal-dependent hydrolase
MSAGAVGDDPRLRAGIEHFARAEWFEAHEIWEDLWRGLRGEDRLAVQALIQAAVALHHFERGNVPGATALHAAATAKLSLLGPERFGLDLEELAAGLDRRLAPLLRAGAVPGPLPVLRRMPK